MASPQKSLFCWMRKVAFLQDLDEGCCYHFISSTSTATQQKCHFFIASLTSNLTRNAFSVDTVKLRLWKGRARSKTWHWVIFTQIWTLCWTRFHPNACRVLHVCNSWRKIHSHKAVCLLTWKKNLTILFIVFFSFLCVYIFKIILRLIHLHSYDS